MKAAVYKGSQQFQIEEIPTPKVGPEQVLVKVKYCAICGTDVHTVFYDITIPGSVMGHEYCGTIVEKGSEVSKWKIGDRVVGGGQDGPVADITDEGRHVGFGLGVGIAGSAAVELAGDPVLAGLVGGGGIDELKGATLPVVQGLPDPAGETAVWLARTAAGPVTVVVVGDLVPVLSFGIFELEGLARIG